MNIAAVWCVGSILLGILFLAAGIGIKIRMNIPYIGIVSGSLGAVLIVLGFAGGIFGLCPF